MRWYTTIPKHPKPNIRYGPPRWIDFKASVELWKEVASCSIQRIGMENPIPHKYARAEIGKYVQTFQPWHFGHREIKRTCLWLKGLPKLRPTDVVGPPPRDHDERRKWARVHQASPSEDRWRIRSLTYPGVAEAMADQWGSLENAE